ncbi:hypothetical protein D5S18_02780 [Nocardia panacis]|uniref:DUF8020 domain-containing protein n=1 Tax=Nocardia panacis TaxID=2340916 RepID=A0A3A4K365_9NOCA|nr:hypothetical protein [Nocardia panacis]RJO79273.1 hypothetical protein D5S18_02780 [Nocardia panacis]
MFIRKLVATSVLAIAATSITTVMAHGEAELAHDVTINGVDGSVAYTTTLAADHSTAVVDLASGKFVLGGDGVTVVAADGATVGTIPTVLRVPTGETYAVTPSLSRNDTSLTLTPVGGPTQAALDSRDLPFTHQADSDGGAVVAGAVIGCVVGIVIGIWFFLVGAIVGCFIGAIIGGLIGLAL